MSTDGVPTDASATPPVRRGRSLGWRLARAGLLFCITPCLTVFVLMIALQRELVFRPTKTGRLLARDVTSPDVTISDVAINARPGLTLHGWRFQPPGALPAPGALPEGEPRLLVLYFPGNGGCRRDRISDCRDFTQLGCEVLLFDYRGYGENGGSPSEANIAADARRVWAYATQELQFPPARILVFGESLGGAVATRLVAELSRGGESPAALLLNSTFSSLADVVRWHYPAIPLQ